MGARWSMGSCGRPLQFLAPYASLAVRLLAFGILSISPCWSAKADPADLVANSALAVTTTRSKMTCLSETLMLTGTIVPQREVLVRPDRDGMQIKEILEEPGDTVTSGQILARLALRNGQQETTIPIRAPVAGMIVAAPSIIGEITSARGEPLFRIIADGELELSAEASANQLARLAVGQAAQVTVMGLNDSPGQVRLVPTVVDAATQLGRVRISLEHNPLVHVGAFARAIIDVGQSCGVTIPLSALLFGPEGAVVQTVHDDRIETRPVKVGLFAHSSVQISEGLAAGDTIVLRSGAFLRDGDRVRAVASGQ